MYYTQIEKMIKILKESKLPKDPQHLAEIEIKMKNYKKLAEKQGGGKEKKFKSSLELENISNEIKLYAYRIMRNAIYRKNEEVVNELCVVLPKLYKEFEVDNQDSIRHPNNMLWRFLASIFTEAKISEGFERAKLNPALSKTRVLIRYGYFEEASNELQDILNSSPSYQMTLIVQLIDNALKYLRQDNRASRKADLQSYQSFLEDDTKTLQKSPITPNQFDIVEFVIDLAKFHPEPRYRELAVAALRKWDKDKNISPSLTSPITAFLNAEANKKQVEKSQSKIKGKWELAKTQQPKVKAEPTKTLSEKELKTMMSAHRKPRKP